MKEHASAPSYKGHRFPPEIIAHAVWLYCRFALSYRDVEELLAERGVILTDETVRQWCRKCGQHYAKDASEMGRGALPSGVAGSVRSARLLVKQRPSRP